MENRELQLLHHLLRRIAQHNARMRRYIVKNGPRKNRLSVICVVSSTVAALITAGPAAGGESFIDIVKNLLDMSTGNASRLVCLTAMLVSAMTAFVANMNQSSQLPARVQAVEVGLAELDKVAMELQFGRMSVSEGCGYVSAVLENTAFLNTEVEVSSHTAHHGWAWSTSS